jgi:ParB family chromosome partitioning protein
MEYKKVRLDKLNFTSTPVRLNRSDEQMRQLKSSISATGGPIDPIIVRDLGDDEYVVVAGESRVKALSELGYAPDYEVPCLVGRFDDKKALEYGLIENYVRNPLSPYEEALVIRSLVQYYGLSQRDVAAKLGKSEHHISHVLSIFYLSDEVQQALHEGRITLAHARELYALRNSEVNQSLILKEILWHDLTVKATRTRIQELIGAGKEWIIEPGETRLSDKSRVAIHPSSEGYKVDFTFSDAEELEKVISYLRNRLRSED